jgi:hypothetical protein
MQFAQVAVIHAKQARRFARGEGEHLFLGIRREEIFALRMQLGREPFRMLTDDGIQVFDILRVAHMPSILVPCSRNMALIAFFP